MPTQRKVEDVEKIRRLIEGCTVAISADYTGLAVGAMTELRRALRKRGVEFRVVKNRLTYLAADAAGKPAMKEIVQGPTGIAFGFDDPLEPAKALTEFVRVTRAPLKIRGGVLGERVLTAQEVSEFAALPTRDELLSRFVGQLQGPIVGLLVVLNAPILALARVLQRTVEARGEDGQASPSPESAVPDLAPQQGREEEATEAPGEATEAPEEATEAPEEATEAPEEATEAPEEATEAPEEAD